MHEPIQLTNTIPAVRNSLNPAPLRRGFLLIPVALAFAWFALSPTARAQLPSPAPDGGYPNGNTAEGDNSLLNLTTGVNNTAIGFDALLFNTTGSFNTANGVGALQNNNADNDTANGYQALLFNTTGTENTANGAFALLNNTTGNNNTANGVSALQNNNADNNTANGFYALLSNTTGTENTAIGFDALALNTTGSSNTANGSGALFNNTTGTNNTADGVEALLSNTTGINNTADGVEALLSNTTGADNTASGVDALFSNTTGNDNTANGFGALFNNTTGTNNTATGFNALSHNTTGKSNIALGFDAGENLITGSNNIDIGNVGSVGESNTIRIGTKGTQRVTLIAGISGATVAGGVGVIVDSNGHLGTVVSSERFKEAIKPMDKASEAILALKPVTFRYKHELDPEGIPQFGLVAEQVEKVNPDLVARDEQGKAYTVRYEAVNAMLLNEFLKEHRKVEELEATVAQQQKVITARLKEQDSKIQAVNERLERAIPLQVADSEATCTAKSKGARVSQ